jgi:hypothetical protein
MAWSATLFCVVFSARVAEGFLRANPRLFTVMALFACNWAVLLPYYGMPAHLARPELLSALGGFLSIYAGGLLMLHAHQPHAPAPDVVTWQVAGVNLLLLVAAESALAIPGRQGTHLLGLSHHQTELAIGVAIVITGFVAIAKGVKDFAGTAPFCVIAAILAAYAALEGRFAWQEWETLETTAIPEFYLYVFAAAKIVYTVSFGSIVGYKGMTDRDRTDPTTGRPRIGHWFLLLLHIRHPHHVAP